LADPEVGVGREGALTSAINPIHYCFQSETEILFVTKLF